MSARGPDPKRVAVLLDRIETDLGELRTLVTPPADPVARRGISTAEAAARFELSERQIRRHCMNGAGQRIGAGWVVYPEKLRTMLKR